MNKTIFLLMLLLPLWLQARNTYNITIPLQSNAWAANQATAEAGILNNREIKNRTSEKHCINAYIYITEPCSLPFAIETDPETQLNLQIKFAGKTYVSLTGKKNITELGMVKFPKAGYYTMEISERKITEATLRNIRNILTTAKKNIVKFIDTENTYFGRRGPSVHFNYAIPAKVSEAEWYYSEIEVPKGQDVIGTYFMANGFGEGYFGIQVNSATERRVLFSVWSPFHTDDPKSIPDDQKIIMLEKGENVRTGEFGNEGSGGQSFLRYQWKAGIRYGFLLRGIPDGNNNSTYTAWFHNPETKEWMLIASFKRPKTNTYLKRFHSFLENFIPDQGDKTRMAIYTNQWVANSKGEWFPVTEATFTYDATAHAQRRFDYAGGVDNNGFFLKMGGFFSDNTTFRSKFVHTTGAKPAIDLEKFR